MNLLVVVGIALAFGFSSAAPTETGENDDVDIYRKNVSNMESIAIYIIKLLAEAATSVADVIDGEEPNAAVAQNANVVSPYANGENAFNQYAYGENANVGNTYGETGGQQWS